MTRTRRVRLWILWALRDTRQRWLQVVSIGLLLALGVGMYTAISSVSIWHRDSADASFAALGMHDLRVSLAEGSYAPAGELHRALDRIPDRRVVLAADERLVVPTQVDASMGGKVIIVPGRIVGAPIGASVDRLAVVRGRTLQAGDDGQPVAELERNFAKHYELPPAGSIRLAGGRQLRYEGQAEAPEYFIVTAPGAEFGAEASLAVLFVPLRSAQVLAGEPGRVSQLVLRVRPGTPLGPVETQLRASLQELLPRIGITFTRAGQEPARRRISNDVDSDQQLTGVIAFMVLAAAAVAAFNLVTRTVEAQRREIGIGMALGAKPRTLARRPFLLGVQVALLGVGLGLPVGLGASVWLKSLMETLYPLPVWRTPLQAELYLRGASLGLLLPLLATAPPVRRALKVTPIEAIQVGTRSAKSSGLAWLIRRIRLPGGSFANMPLRNVLRTPRRTLTTVLGIAAVVTIVVAFAGLLDSLSKTFAESREEALAGATNRLTVDLSAPQPSSSRIIQQIRRSSAVDAAQESLRLPITLTAGPRRIEAFLEVVDLEGPVWHPTLRAGRLPETRPGVVIAQLAANDLRVDIGDPVSVRHPVSTGPGSYQLVSTTLTVTGIHTSPFRFIAYANRSAAPALHLSGLTNRISVTPGAERSSDDVKRALLPLPNVVAVQDAAAMTDAVDQHMKQFTKVLAVMVMIAATMVLLIAFNSTAINVDERAREHATMFAYGVRASHVVGENMLEALLTGVLGSAVGIAAGYGILGWLAGGITPDIGLLVSLRPVTYAFVVLAGTVIFSLAPLLMLRRLRHTNIPAALRVVE